jgi:hypothetical protein
MATEANKLPGVDVFHLLVQANGRMAEPHADGKVHQAFSRPPATQQAIRHRVRRLSALPVG